MKSWTKLEDDGVAADIIEDEENHLGREKEDNVSLDDKSGSCCVCLSRPATVSSLNRHDVN